MSKRGPRPRPTVLKIVNGNPGKRPLNTNEPKPKGGLPECPEYLSDKAKAAWSQFAAQLTAAGVATSLDATALELLCNSYAQYLDGADKVAAHGAVWVTKSAGPFPAVQYSPWWSVMNRAWKQVCSMLSEFGMTPSSRSRVAAVNKPKQSIEAFIASKFA